MRHAEAIYDLIVRFPRAAILASIAVALAFVAFVDVEIDTRIEIWFLDGDTAVETYDRYVERFETDEFAAVAVVADDVFDADVLRTVDALSDALAELGPVVSVQSLATAEHVESDGQTLEVGPLLQGGVPETDEALEALRATVHADRLLRGLVTDDDTATVLVVAHRPFDDLADKAQFAIDVRDVASEYVPREQLRVAGNAFVEEALQTYTLHDMQLLAPLIVLAIILITFALFRDIWCTIVPTVIVGLTLGSTIGLAGVVGMKLNIITTIVMPLAVAVGVADSVHLLSGFRERLGEGVPPKDAMRRAWAELLFPCLITTATTAAGLLSLMAANLKPIRQFGWMGAATVVFALIYTLVLVPAVFTLVRPPAPKPRDSGTMSRILAAVANTAWRHHKIVLAGLVVLVGLSAYGATRIEVGADFSAYFKPDDPLFVDSRYIDEHLGGTGSVDLMVEAPDVRTPEILAALDEFDGYISQNPAVRSTDSPATLVMTLHERYFGDPERYRLPDSLAAAAQLLSQTEGTRINESLFTVDYTATRVRGRIRSSDYRELVLAMDTIEADTAIMFDGIAEAEITGLGKLIANLDRYIIRSQIRSFLLAFFVVGVLLGIFFRSVHFGLWAIVPNALPILLVLGVMGWFGVLLDVGTVMVASIMLGLIVDDTVHYLARYRREYLALSPDALANAEERRKAALRTGVGTGGAIATTSVILACGFWVSLFASFQPNINFGLMCGAATMIALICDLVALPAVIRLFPLRDAPASE